MAAIVDALRLGIVNEVQVTMVGQEVLAAL
jgi:hypothetical protein